jgi:hypothetical protein
MSDDQLRTLPESGIVSHETIRLADLGRHQDVQLLTVIDVEELDHARADRKDLMRLKPRVVDQQDFIRDPKSFRQLLEGSFVPPANVLLRE